MLVAILLAHVKPSHAPPELCHVVHQALFRSAPSVIHTGGRSVRVVLMSEFGSLPYTIPMIPVSNLRLSKESASGVIGYIPEGIALLRSEI
jgi:hypothetical protein